MLCVIYIFKKKETNAKPVYGERNKGPYRVGGGRELTGNGYKRTFFKSLF